MRKLLDLVAPMRPASGVTGYRRLLHWAALPVTDRRWAAPLCAAALGFGIFAGVAISPGTTGSLAGAPQLIELPGVLGGDDGGAEAEPEVATGGEGFPESGGGGEEAEAEIPFEASSSSFESFPAAEVPVEEEPVPTSPEEEPAEEPEPEEEAQVVSGVVVHVNPAAGSYTVAAAGGLLSAVHAAKLPVTGARVSVPALSLANGTFAEMGARKQTGTGAEAELAGTVTFVDPDPLAPAYAVSKRGVSVLVHVRPDPTAAAPALPQLGAYAMVKATIEQPQPAAAGSLEAAPAPDPAAPPACAPDPAAPPLVPAPTALLWQSEVEADGAPFASSDFAGVVSAVCAAGGKLALSADDLRQSGADLVFTVPKQIDLSKLEPGESVLATAAFEADGSLRLTGLAGDERRQGADDAAATQGDLASHAPR